jgi:hypothetical protein
MTEDEAKTKWCHKNIDPVRANRKCLGSDCMAWRWEMAWESQSEEGVGGDVVLRLKRRKGEPKMGFCGLAGVPMP